CRKDLVVAAASDSESFPSAFDWINGRQAILATSVCNIPAPEIREYARDWILGGGEIRCVPETDRPERRHFHYNITIDGVPGFSRGLYVKLELFCTDEKTPTVNMLNAHEPTF